jgi:hypothetical protein
MISCLLVKCQLKSVKGSPQLSDLQTQGYGNNHGKLDLQRSSIFKEEQQEDYLSPYVPVASNLDEKVDYDEEEGDVVSNLFQDHIVDDYMQKYSSLPLGFYPDVPIFDKYSDEEEEFKNYKGLLTNGITSSSTFQQRDDQQCIHAMVDNSYESVVPNTYEDPLISDTFLKDIIVGESNQQFFHDISFKTHLSFDHYEDSDVEDQEHISSFLSEIVSYNEPTHHSDGSKSQGYGKGEHKGLDEKLIMHVSLSVVEKQQVLYEFQDPVATYMEMFCSNEVSVVAIFKARFLDCKYDFKDYDLHATIRVFVTLHKVGRKVQVVSQLLTWMHWRFSFT